MIAKGIVMDRIQSLIQDSSSETEAKILEHLNSSYYSIATKHIWRDLVRQVTVPSTGLLPADLERIIYVEDATDKLYFKIGFPQRYFSQKLYNYFDNIVVTTVLATGSDMVVTANSTSVTSAAAAFTSAMIGEYIRIGQNRGIYKIAAVPLATTLTLVDAYRGASATGQTYNIRPYGTRQITETDQNGDAITSSTIKLWYLKTPLPLYNDTDMIELPGECDAVRIKTLQLLMVADKYDNDSLKQAGNFEEAYAEMKSLSPVPERFVIPRDRLGNRVAFGRLHNRSINSIHSNDVSIY